MQPLVNTTKKATNITLSSDVLTEAKALGINISQSCDQFLRELVRKEREHAGSRITPISSPLIIKR